MTTRSDWAVIYRLPTDGSFSSVSIHTTYELACEAAAKLARENPGMEVGVFGSVEFLVWEIAKRPGRYDKSGDLR